VTNGKGVHLDWLRQTLITPICYVRDVTFGPLLVLVLTPFSRGTRGGTQLVNGVPGRLCSKSEAAIRRLKTELGLTRFPDWTPLARAMGLNGSQRGNIFENLSLIGRMFRLARPNEAEL